MLKRLEARQSDLKSHRWRLLSGHVQSLDYRFTTLAGGTEDQTLAATILRMLGCYGLLETPMA